MIDFSRNHFELFGLPRRFVVEPETLERAYHELQSAVHPDRHAAAGDAEQRLALQASARVNEAYRALKDPVSRAQYLLSLHGIEALGETDTSLAMEFLERQLERREAAETAATAHDASTLETILAAVRAETNEREQRLGPLLDNEPSLADARQCVRELKFLQKLAEDLDAMLAQLDDLVPEQ